jgi:hypothetical protein
MKKNKKKVTGSKKAKPEATDAPATEPVEATSSTNKPTEDTPEDKGEDKPKEEPEVKAEETSEKEPEKNLEEPSKDDSEEFSPSATPSLAQQSKLRSTSFRYGSIPSAGATSPVPFSPDGDTAPEIYRKHVAKIEELEKENKRLAKEASDSEKRWQKSEEELAVLREADGDDDDATGDENVDKLVRIYTKLACRLANNSNRRVSLPHFNDKTHSFSNKYRVAQLMAMVTGPPSRCPLHLLSSRRSLLPKRRRSNPWRLKSQSSRHKPSVMQVVHLRKRNRSQP